MALDRIPGDANLYIGGLFTLRRKQAVKEANITHVLSVLRLPLDLDLFKDFEHLLVEVDDVDDDNILEHFPRSNAFIQQGLHGGGGVLVHCAMGKSRSTTLLTAYLLSTTPTHTPTSALQLIRQARPFAEPNPGFLSQLSLYHRMGCPSDVDAHPMYQRWLWERIGRESEVTRLAPEVEGMKFADENGGNDGAGGERSSSPSPSPSPPTPSAPPQSPPQLTYRCRRCRTPLASTPHILPHTPKPPNPTTTTSIPPCAHIHISPLSWMRPELSLGKLDGRLECPNHKCGQSVGRYAWQGIRCSCGEWVVPGVTLGRGRVDEVRGGGGSGGGRGRGKM